MVVNGTFAKAVALAFHWTEREIYSASSRWNGRTGATPHIRYDVRCHNKCIQTSRENKFNQDWDRNDERKKRKYSYHIGFWLGRQSLWHCGAAATKAKRYHHFSFMNFYCLFFSLLFFFLLHYISLVNPHNGKQDCTHGNYTVQMCSMQTDVGKWVSQDTAWPMYGDAHTNAIHCDWTSQLSDTVREFI